MRKSKNKKRHKLASKKVGVYEVNIPNVPKDDDGDYFASILNKYFTGDKDPADVLEELKNKSKDGSITLTLDDEIPVNSKWNDGYGYFKQGRKQEYYLEIIAEPHAVDVIVDVLCDASNNMDVRHLEDIGEFEYKLIVGGFDGDFPFDTLIDMIEKYEVSANLSVMAEHFQDILTFYNGVMRKQFRMNNLQEPHNFTCDNFKFYHDLLELKWSETKIRCRLRAKGLEYMPMVKVIIDDEEFITTFDIPYGMDIEEGMEKLREKYPTLPTEELQLASLRSMKNKSKDGIVHFTLLD